MVKVAAPTINESMKMISVNLLNSMRLTDIFFGTVISVSPLKIQIDQKHILEQPSLILSNAVKDHEVDITVSMMTVDDNYLDEKAKNHTHGGSTLTGNMGAAIAGNTDVTNDFDTTHHHDIKGRKKIIIHNGLLLDEKVILLRMQGGQRYFVIDRVSEHICEGEWL